MAINQGKIFFIDTNILLTATDQSRNEHKEAKELFFKAAKMEIQLATCGQIIREYYSVATRSKSVNGFDLTPSQAVSNIHSILQFLIFFDETEQVYQELIRLMKAHQIVGNHIHDANLVALMSVNNINKIVTQNTDDFKMFSAINTFNLNDFHSAI
jgi:predicted nucleic acid-binding protein